MVGVTALTLRLLGGWLLVCRLSRRARPLAGLCDEALSRLARALRIGRAVRLLESSLVQVPVVIGGLRPVILLPACALTGLSPGQLEALLAHELAHIDRHDYLVNLVQSAIEVLLFYHPAAWWTSRVIRAEREHCCDALAVRVCGDPLAYARALAAMEGLRSTPCPSLAASGGSLLARVRRILNPEVESMYRLPVVGPGAALLIGSVLLVAAPAGQPERPATVTQGNARQHTTEQSDNEHHPRIGTVYVPVFRSTTFRRDVQLCLTAAVIKEIEGRTTFKVVGAPEEADTILEGTINFAQENLTAEDPSTLHLQLPARVEATVRRLHSPPLESERKSPPEKFLARLTFDPEAVASSQAACLSMCANLAKQIARVMQSNGAASASDEPEPGVIGDAHADRERDDHGMDPISASAASMTIQLDQGRVMRFFPRHGKENFSFDTFKTADGGTMTVMHGGIEIVSETVQFGIIDISADSAVFWRRGEPEGSRSTPTGHKGETIDNGGRPMEVYLEGNVVILQDIRKGKEAGQQKTMRARRAYYDFRTNRFSGLGG
jgi:hypothetical protein